MTNAFVDTNILLYAVSNRDEEADKRVVARELLSNSDLGLSTQVLQEFYWNVVKPHKFGLSHEEAVLYVETWKQFPIQPLTLQIVDDALEVCKRFQIGYWDAAIIATAQHLGCDTVYSEDLNTGQTYSGITIVNPFH